MKKRAVVLAVLLALVMVILSQAVALADSGVQSDIPAKSMDDFLGVVKNVVSKVMLFVSILLVAIAVILGAKIAWSGVIVRPQERSEAVAGIFYLLLGAAVSFGVYWWLGLAKGLVH